MRYLIRRELDLNEPVNLRRLSPMMKVYAGIASKWHDTKFYRTRLNKRLEADYAAKVKRDEKLKEAMMVIIYKELDSNSLLSSKGEESQELVLCIKSNFIHSLDRILTHKDFLPYVVTKVEEDPDVRKAFPEMPVLVKVSKKKLQEVQVCDEC